MRFDFFRRSEPQHEAVDKRPHDGATASVAAAQRSTDPAEAPGHIVHAMLLDGRKRVAGYRLGWRPSTAAAGQGGSVGFKVLLRAIAQHLNGDGRQWALDELELFVDATIESLFAGELQALPAEHMVLCMSLEDLSDVDARPMLMYLREQGFGFMLCGASGFPEDPELRRIITHMDVGAINPLLLARLREGPDPVRVQWIATRMHDLSDLDASAGFHMKAFVDGGFPLLPVRQVVDALQPDAQLIVQLMRMIHRNEDVREIEASLKLDARLTYRLLRHINSPAIGGAVEVHSLRHAVSMLGYAPMFRWLTILLASSHTTAGTPYMTKKAIIRGRFVELLGQGLLPPAEADNLFVVGMLSLIDQLLGLPIAEVLQHVNLPEPVQDAILRRTGVYGPFLALAESCESDGALAAELSEELFLSPEQVNSAHLTALAWAQDVGTGAEAA
ncbi:EAL and HDOD domain-containing protein [Variovorax sp. ZT4R33]|uniref:EAL and HDOD domain-containing protein n=1 Tax=Variovorax sp. ZT4R33 TaxID=3443743 RepID=UPI003F44B336